MKMQGITIWKHNGKSSLTERLPENLTSGCNSVFTIKPPQHSVQIDPLGKAPTPRAGLLVGADGPQAALMLELHNFPDITDTILSEVDHA